MKFKVGDIVTGNSSNKYAYTTSEATMEVVELIVTSDDSIRVKILENIDGSEIGNTFIVKPRYFTLVKKDKKGKPQPVDDLVRYMVHGQGCNNKSDFMRTEKELKDSLKRLSHDSCWTGRLIGYKLTPIYEAEKKTILKVLGKSIKKTVLKKTVKRSSPRKSR